MEKWKCQNTMLKELVGWDKLMVHRKNFLLEACPDTLATKNNFLLFFILNSSLALQRYSNTVR